MLLEAFHWWAWQAGFDVEVAGTRIPSTSFADDLALIATSLGDIEALIAAYLEWCQLQPRCGILRPCC